MTLRFRVLGPPQVQGNAGSVAIAGSRPGALLSALAVSANALVTTARLAGALWEKRPAEPAMEVAAAVDELRLSLRSAGELADGRLIRRIDGHLLCADLEELDLDQFTLLFRQGRAALEADDHYAAVHLLGHALALWRGPAGDGCQAYGWLRQRLDDMNELRHLAIESRMMARLMLGQTAEVVAEARRLLVGDPLDERWWACLVAGLRDAGEQGAAQDAHERARRAYLEEYGSLPDPVRRLLHLALLPPQLRESAHWMNPTTHRSSKRNDRERWRKPAHWVNSRAIP